MNTPFLFSLGKPGRRGLVCAALLLSAVAAYGAGSSPVATTYAVVIEGMKLVPEVLQLHVGDTVVWTNKDFFPHTVVAQNGHFQSGEIAPDSSWKFKADAKGEFAYICTLHPTMKGKLVVK